MVTGVRIPMSEESIATVTGLPRTEDRWFHRKTHLSDAHKGFLVNTEKVQTKGKGEDVNFLPDPWGKVTKFLKRYITCEGRYQVVYFFDFILLSHLRHQKFIKIPYFLLHSLHNMAHFVKKSKNPKNCISNHRLIGILIHIGMGISNNPLPVVADQPHSVHTDMSAPVLENTTHGPLPEPLPSTAIVVQTPTVIACTMTQKINRITQIHPGTSRTSCDKIALQQPVAIVKQIDEHPTTRSRHASQHLAATPIIKNLPSVSKKKTYAPISGSSRKRTRSAWSIATPIIDNLSHVSEKKTLVPISASPKNQAISAWSTVTSSPLTSSSIAPTITQNPPIVATTDQASTIITSALFVGCGA
jgi:hypothetical protein